MIDRIPEIFFEGQEELTTRNVTLAYDIRPFGVGRWNCEGLLSYTLRLAIAHRVTPIELMRFLASRSKSGRSLLGHLICHRRINYEYHLFLVGYTTKRMCDILSEATGVASLENHTLLPLKDVLSNWKLKRFERMYCPTCAAGRSIQSQGEMLVAALSCVGACPIHGVELVPVRCGSPNRLERFGIAPQLPGVCPDCGMVGHKCHAAMARPASELNTWVARQMGSLVASFGSNTEITSEKMIYAIGQLANEKYEGKIARLARAAGIPKSTLHQWMHRNLKPNLSQLLRLCCAAQVSLHMLMYGEIRNSPAPVKFSWTARKKNRSHAHRRKAIEKALRAELHSYPCRSITKMGEVLKLDDSWIRYAFPKLASRIAKTAAHHREMEKRRRRLEAKRAVLIAARKLRERGESLTRRNFEKLLGTIISNTLINREFRTLRAHIYDY